MTYGQETRILKPSKRSASHALITMPKTTWYWLDDLVHQRFPYNGYKALIAEFAGSAACPATLVQTLKTLAREHGDSRMSALYNLSNDNSMVGQKCTKEAHVPASIPRENPDLSSRMPSVYQLFRFMPHATYLTTVWERRNFATKPTYQDR